MLQSVLWLLPNFVFFSICLASTVDCQEPCRQSQRLPPRSGVPGLSFTIRSTWAAGLPQLSGGLSLPPEGPSLPLRSTTKIPHAHAVGSCLWGSPPAGLGPCEGFDRVSEIEAVTGV